MVKPVAPVNASVASVRVSQYYDSVRRGDGFEASPADRRATVKAWASYKKTGKKQYVQPQKKKTARQQQEALLLTANGAQAINQEGVNAHNNRERRERDRVGGASGRYGDAQMQLVRALANSERRAEEHRERVAQKNGAAAGGEDGQAKAAREEKERRYSAKLAKAEETVKGLSIGVVEKAANSPLEMISNITGIQGLRAEDIQRLCVEALRRLTQPTHKIMRTVATPHPDKKQTEVDFGGVVTLSARQNEQGISPRRAIQIAVELVDSRTLASVGFSLTMPWNQHGASAVLAY